MSSAGREITERLIGAPRAGTGVTSEPAEPWFLRWYALAAAGAVVVGGGVALALLLARDTPERVTFTLGRN